MDFEQISNIRKYILQIIQPPHPYFHPMSAIFFETADRSRIFRGRSLLMKIRKKEKGARLPCQRAVQENRGRSLALPARGPDEPPEAIACPARERVRRTAGARLPNNEGARRTAATFRKIIKLLHGLFLFLFSTAR